MRILHVSDFFPPVRGGLEGHVDDLSAAQAASGHEVHVATLTPGATPSDPRVHAHVVRAASLSVLPYADADRPFHPPLPDPRARRALVRLLDRIRPDVVHAHSWLGVSLPRRTGVPTVLTAHDFALVCQLRTLLRPDGSACTGPSLRGCTGCARRCGGLVRGALLASGTSVGRRRWPIDRIVTLSEHVARTLRPHVDVPVEVCGGLLGPAARSARPAGLPEGPFVLFAGDPSTHKGIEVLLDAWHEPDVASVPLVVAASRPFERPVPPGLTVVHLQREEMAAAWGAAAIAVVPSVWPEPFGMVAMEALSSGTPVVASAVGALPEIVRHGIDGVLVPPGDPRALATAVASLLEDPDRLDAMGAAASAGAGRFAADRLVARLDEVYASALGASLEACR